METEEDWLERIYSGEDSTLELKAVKISPSGRVLQPHPDGLSDELAAMANASGGNVIL